MDFLPMLKAPSRAPTFSIGIARALAKSARRGAGAVPDWNIRRRRRLIEAEDGLNWTSKNRLFTAKAEVPPDFSIRRGWKCFRMTKHS
jgi:hypothetical protein